MRSKQGAQQAFEGKNSYGPNVSQFEGYIPRCEDEVQQIKHSTIAAISSGKRKKSTLDKYFAPRTSQGAQPFIKSVFVRN